MKVILQEVEEGIESEIIIRYHTMDEKIKGLIHLLESPDEKIVGGIEDSTYILDPDKIFYIETVDNKVFIYGENDVFESKKRLYELEAFLSAHHFFRASKSLILNINKIKYVKPTLDGRLEAHLKNDEKVFISRKYVSVLKGLLGI